jgi:SAM-dependent methyltransferase
VFKSYAEIFDRRATAYDSAMRDWPRARDREFEAVLEPLRDGPDGLVCDIPSGGGYLAAYLRPGLRYLGVDPAEDYAAAGQAALNAPIFDVPRPDGSVDYIVSLAGLHHEADLPRIFAEMRRLLRPAGRLVIADVAVGTPPAHFLNGFVARHNPDGHDGRFLDEALPAMLTAVGLAIANDRLIPTPWAFASPREAGTFCSDLFGIAGLSADDVAGALEREIGFDADDGQVQLRWTLRRIVCDVTEPPPAGGDSAWPG